MSDPSRMLTFSSFFSSHFHRKHISMYPQENERELTRSQIDVQKCVISLAIHGASMDFLQIYGKNGNYEFGILYRIFDKI